MNEAAARWGWGWPCLGSSLLCMASALFTADFSAQLRWKTSSKYALEAGSSISNLSTSLLKSNIFLWAVVFILLKQMVAFWTAPLWFPRRALLIHISSGWQFNYNRFYIYSHIANILAPILPTRHIHTSICSIPHKFIANRWCRVGIYPQSVLTCLHGYVKQTKDRTASI